MIILNSQALDSARICIEPETDDGTSVVSLEKGIPAPVADALSGLGHTVSLVEGHARALFGRGQVIRSLDGGVLEAGSDPRADGCPFGW